MQSFEWANAATVEDAVKLLAPVDPKADPDEMPRPMGGGQDLLTTMKTYITRPPRVVNLKTIGGMGGVTADAAGIHIGALVTLSDLAENSSAQKLAPGLIDAVHSIATPQIRNLGTVGGNLGQRPRCWYFRLENIKCLKRGGETCFAREGENKYHAIFDTDGPCVMTHPSDLAPMLTTLGATVSFTGPAGVKSVPVAEFFVKPTAENLRVETVLPVGSVITGVTIPSSPMLARSAYVKFKERESLDFAMASVAAAVELNGDGTVKQGRITLGGVAPVPWPLPKVGDFLAGKRIDETVATRAGEIAIDGAKPLSQNGYKLRLVKTIVKRALLKVAAM